jgi:molecular chaperone GrpE (heat shock protein)
MLDKAWKAFEAMDKYVMVQQWLLIMKNPELAKEFSTAWVWDIKRSLDAIKNYKEMQAEVFEDAWMSNDQSYMTFQEIQQYSLLVDKINKWEKTEEDLIEFLNNLKSKTKETEKLKKELEKDLLKVAEEKIEKSWWDLEEVFDETMDEILDEDFLIAE